MAGGRELATEARGDHSLAALIAANVVALLIAHATGMSLQELLMVYWIQSLIIGIGTFVRILNLKQFSGIKVNRQWLLESSDQKRNFALTFLVHYGVFLFVFIALLHTKLGLRIGSSATSHLLCGLAFAACHGHSLLQNVRRDALGRPNIVLMTLLPYPRIAPMHLTIIVGGLFFDGSAPFFLFAALKIAADAAMHVVEQRVLAGGSVLPPNA